MTDSKKPMKSELLRIRAAEIEQRIASENERLAAEDVVEKDLAVDRKRLLTQGTDQDVDTIENKIDQSRSTQVRILERIELLEGELKDAEQNAEDAALDELATTAQEQRDRGVAIIQKVYPALAKKIADAMRELHGIEIFISNANSRLAANNRLANTLNQANHVRFQLAQGGVADLPEPLHETVNLPSELPGSSQPPYWAKRDRQLDALRARLGVA
jgi:hypothetical protein